LEYCSQALILREKEQQRVNLEKIQRRARYKNGERLKRLKLPSASVQYRRKPGDLIQTYKYLKGTSLV
jgi:hypothetical protein